MRWILTILIALIILLGALPGLRRIGIGRLPGDINFRIGKHRVSIPIMSTILIMVAAFLIGRLI